MIHKAILGAACTASLVILACSSSNGANGGDGGGGGGGPSSCKTYHACQLLTADQANSATMIDADAGTESNLSTPFNSSSCVYEGMNMQGMNMFVTLSLTCGEPGTPADTIAAWMQSGHAVTNVPNLGNQAITVDNDSVQVWAGTNSIVNFRVAIVFLTADAGIPVNAVSEAETLARQVLPQL